MPSYQAFRSVHYLQSVSCATVQIPTNHLSFDVSALWCLLCRFCTFRQTSPLRRRPTCGLKFDNRRTIWAWSWCPQPSTSATGIVSKRYYAAQNHRMRSSNTENKLAVAANSRVVAETGSTRYCIRIKAAQVEKIEKMTTPAQRGKEKLRARVTLS